MTKEEVFHFLRSNKLAVISSLGPGGAPQSALVGIGVTPDLSLVFDTLKTSRKARNLALHPACSLVLGWAAEVTVQLEGVATGYPVEAEGPWKEAYFEAWPDGRDRLSWPGLTYFVVSPLWLRYSDFGQNPPVIVEFSFP
jgi:pyridoxine/pyridoxamine 5'-phosphate oxidase